MQKPVPVKTGTDEWIPAPHFHGDKLRGNDVGGPDNMTEDRQSDESRGRFETCPYSPEQMEAELDEVTDLQARLDEAEREKDQFRSMALRYRADLENYKKTRDPGNGRYQGARERNSFLLKLVGVADDFTRAINYMRESAPGPQQDAPSLHGCRARPAGSWYEGVQLVQRSMENMLQSEGLSRIEAAIGQPFDVSPNTRPVFFEPTGRSE